MNAHISFTNLKTRVCDALDPRFFQQFYGQNLERALLTLRFKDFVPVPHVHGPEGCIYSRCTTVNAKNGGVKLKGGLLELHLVMEKEYFDKVQEEMLSRLDAQADAQDVAQDNSVDQQYTVQRNATPGPSHQRDNLFLSAAFIRTPSPPSPKRSPSPPRIPSVVKGKGKDKVCTLFLPGLTVVTYSY